jgi:hypothetical protein
MAPNYPLNTTDTLQQATLVMCEVAVFSCSGRARWNSCEQSLLATGRRISPFAAVSNDRFLNTSIFVQTITPLVSFHTEIDPEPLESCLRGPIAPTILGCGLDS